MFKSKSFLPFYFVLLACLIGGSQMQTDVVAAGSCPGNCKLCPIFLLQCYNLPDPVRLNRNQACNPYSIGPDCNDIPNVY